MNRRYEGPCVGGPLDKQKSSHPGAHFTVDVKASPPEGGEPVHVATEHYYFEDTNVTTSTGMEELRFWRHQSFPDAQSAIVHAMRNYGEG